jgi:hypothetical protein
MFAAPLESSVRGVGCDYTRFVFLSSFFVVGIGKRESVCLLAGHTAFGNANKIKRGASIVARRTKGL